MKIKRHKPTEETPTEDDEHLTEEEAAAPPAKRAKKPKDETPPKPQPQNIEEAWAMTVKPVPDFRGGTQVLACKIFMINYRGEAYFRIVTREHEKFANSFAWPVTVALPRLRTERLGTTQRIEFGIIRRGETKVSEWRTLGDFPRFNESHRRRGVKDLPDYVIMTHHWIPVAADARIPT